MAFASTQTGGRPKTSVDMASHALNLFIDLLYSFRVSGMCLFIDIRAASYSVLRPLLYQSGRTRMLLPNLFIYLGCRIHVLGRYLSCFAEPLRWDRPVLRLTCKRLPTHGTTTCGGKYGDMVLLPGRVVGFV